MLRARSLSLLTFVLSILVACGAPRPAASQALRARGGDYELELLVDGVPVRTFSHRGETHALGQQGRRYTLRVHNRSDRRIEAVVSVDGLDVIDGKPGDFTQKRGYLVPAYGSVEIDGFRLNHREAAAFRFAPIAESYAQKSGRPRHVGVIGVAVFPERPIPAAPLPSVIAEPPALYEEEAAGDYQRAPRSAPSAESAAPSAPRGAAPPAAPPAARPAESRAAQKSAPAPRRERSGLGTEFGEAVASAIYEVEFAREHPTRPARLLGARYNDRAGLLALGIDVDGASAPSDLALRQSAQPFPRSPGRFAQPPSDWRRD